MESALRELARGGAPEDEVSVIARLRRDGLVPSELRVIARFGLIVTGRVLRRDIDIVRGLVASLKKPQLYSATLDVADDEDGADNEDGVEEAADDLAPRPGDTRRTPGLPTGAGVVVAHLDWGLDFTHPAFRRADGSTRLLTLWDQGAVYDLAHPNRYGFGRIHSRADIDRALQTSDPFAALRYRWWMSDQTAGSHGTHTAGISAGGGLDGGEPGLAPEADIVFVDLTTRTPEGTKPLGDSSDLIEGVDFAIRCAGDRPLVISASLGRQGGEKDGRTLTEQALDAMLAERPGRAMAMSCGNYYAKAAHARVTLDPGETHRFELDLSPGHRRSEIDLWYPRADRIALAIAGPSGAGAGPLRGDEEADIRCNGRVVGRLYNRTNDPNNGDSQGSVFLYPDAPPGRWSLTLHGEAVGDGRVHAWVERDPAGAGRLRFVASDVAPETTIGTICCGFHTVAVAAYDAHDPVRAPGRFSSAGPTRDGRNNRPGCAAPGVQVISARSTPRDRHDAPRHSRMSGTSMAAPYVAGTMALIFAAAGRPLWIEEVREALIGSVEPVPQEQRLRFGAGYCVPAAAVARAAAIGARPASVRLDRGAQRPFRTSIDQEDTMIEGDMYDGPPEGCDADDEGEEAFASTWQDDEAGRRWREPPPLPFQFQIPIGGAGGFGIGVPIGGRSSPFALSLPLGGAAASAPQTQVVLNQPAPLAPAPVTNEPSIVTALDLPADPMTVATEAAVEASELAEAPEVSCCPDCAAREDEMALAEAASIDALERRFARPDYSEVDARYAGEHIMASVATMTESFASAADMLTDLGEAIGGGEVEGEAAGAAGQPSLAALFRDAVVGGHPARLFGRAVRVLLRPGDPLRGDLPMRGDLLLRAVPGQGWAQLSFVAADGLLPGARTVALGYRPEADPALMPGRFAHVVELWPVRRPEDARFARRLVNAADLVTHDTVLLRLVPTGESQEAGSWSEDEAAPPLAPGASGAAVAELQHRLNALHAARTAAGLPGLGDLPLMEDGTFGTRVRDAVTTLQRAAPIGLVGRVDGVVDAATWRALAMLEAAVALIALPRPLATPTEVDGPIAASELIEQHLPLLAGHRGTAPDLVLRWNAMPAQTDRVDVVVHLHGFSGRGQSMRIDRDKLPVSGLDYADPRDATTIGRTAPTLAILPRGNFYGGRSGMGYDFPALLPTGALGQLITQSLQLFARANGREQVAMGRLILTAHSGGGAALMHLLTDHDPDEVHSFDALYNAPGSLIRWAQAKLRGADAVTSAMRVLYRAGEGTAAHSRLVAQAIAAAVRANPVLARRWRVDAVGTPHNDIPPRYGWRLLADAGADVVGAPTAAATAPRRSEGEEMTWREAEDAARSLDAAEAGDATDAEDDAPAGGLDQTTLDRLAIATFGTTAELQAFFAGGFQDWFNANLSGQPPFRRPAGAPLHMQTSSAEWRHFAEFWDRVQIGYDLPRISLLEFAALIAIIMNETDGRFAGASEKGGRPGGAHPGLAYFFDRIGHKASYNSGNSLGNRTAGQLFDDPVFVRAHGHLGGAARYAHRGSADNGIWHGAAYPADAPTGMNDPAAAFVREADFCKFRGRGVIQTTGRDGYKRHVNYIRTYRGGDAEVLALQTAWRGFATDDEVCTASTNADWDRWFARPDTLVLGLRLHAGPHGYQHMARTADLLNHRASRRHAPLGAIATMGLRISGGTTYANGLYRDRVLTLMQAMAARLGSGAQPLVPATVRSPRDGRELEHRAADRPGASPESTGRGAVTPPDEATARAQWNANPSAHRWFTNGITDYLRFAPAFAARGIADAAAYLAANIVEVSFLSNRSPGHRDLVGPLASAEQALAGHIVDPALSSFWSLNVRPIAGTQRLSKHGLGRAIDFSWRTNPHIKAAADFVVIEAVTGSDLRRETTPARLHALSAQFQRNFAAWRAAPPEGPAARAIADPAVLRRLAGYAATGFCTLDVRLIEALIAGGLRWGGAWPSSKDFMHFELA